MTEEQQPKIKIVIPPQVLEQMQQDMTPEELASLFSQLEAAIEDGSLFDDSVPVDLAVMEQEDPEEFAKLKAAMAEDGFDDFDDWVEFVSKQRPTLN